MLFFGMMVICYLRLYLGVGLLGFQDEYHWVGAAALSAHGGVPFINDTNIQQLCGLIYEPVVALYYKLFGNFGVLLVVRHLYFLATVGAAWLFFVLFRTKVDFISALALAALPLVGLSWGVPSLGYNAIGGLCFGCGSLLAVRGLERGHARMIAWSGFLFFIALAVYPTLLGALLVLWTFITLSCLALRKPFWRQLLLGNSITAGLLIVFILSLIWRSSFADLMFAYKFSTMQSSMGNLWAKLGYGLLLLKGFCPPFWLLIPWFLLWLGLWFWREVPWQFFVIPVSVYIAVQEPPESGAYYPAMYLVIAVSGLPLVIRAVRQDFARNWAEFVLWATGLTAVIFPWWASALTLYVTFVTSTYCCAPLFVFSQTRRSRPWLSLLLMIIPLLVFKQKVAMGQTDDVVPLRELVMMEDGPYAGLFTSAARAEWLRGIEADLAAASVDARSILFYDEFPLGFLMTPLYPATRSIYMHGLGESARVRDYYPQFYSDPLMRPDVIFRFKYFMFNGRKISVDPAQYLPQKDSFWRYLPEETGDYELVFDRESYSVFKGKIKR